MDLRLVSIFSKSTRLSSWLAFGKITQAGTYGGLEEAWEGDSAIFLIKLFYTLLVERSVAANHLRAVCERLFEGGNAVACSIRIPASSQNNCL